MAKAEQSFAAMRAGLEQRGLIADAGDGYRLTAAGHAHVEGLLDELAGSEALPPRKAPVIWNFKWRSDGAQLAGGARG